MKINEIIRNAIEEDMINGDVTTELTIPEDNKSTARLIAKEDGVISGIEIFEQVMSNFPNVNIDFKVSNKELITKGQILALIDGNTRSILKGERIALNIMQRMSGIATKTRKFVDELEGHTKLLDTRKTTPNFRVIEKLAVVHGGGVNHRFSLSDMIMIKDNHIKGVGSLTKAVELAKAGSDLKVEVEVESIDMLNEALNTDCDRIMLDNMNLETMKKCVEINNGKKELEASGNMTIDRVKDVSKIGVDFISVGELTHSVSSLDISLKFD